MPANNAVTALNLMFMVQMALGSVGMIALAYSGYLYGILSVFAVTIGSGIYLMKLTFNCIRRRDMNDVKFSHVGISKTQHNGHEIIARSFTNNPTQFAAAIPNTSNSRNIHEVAKFLK